MNRASKLIEDLNGGIIAIRTEHTRLQANVIRTTDQATDLKDADFVIVTPTRRAAFQTICPNMTLYSQRDSRWRHLVYAGGLTFGAAGCYTVAVAIVLSLAGYEDDPPTVAARLRDAGCYSGALMARPNRIPDIYPRVRYDGTLRWHKIPADTKRFREELAKGPTIIEVDFRPPTVKLNQHFVVAEQLTADGDLMIVDPWDGARTKLLERYAKDNWDLARALYGMRLLRAKT